MRGEGEQREREGGDRERNSKSEDFWEQKLVIFRKKLISVVHFARTTCSREPDEAAVVVLSDEADAVVVVGEDAVVVLAAVPATGVVVVGTGAEPWLERVWRCGHTLPLSRGCDRLPSAEPIL